uniref:murein hydrolase activator NlpD n=1 Tax=Glaesserella sp. TaxID=2094731 RepID=UPI00359FF521
PQPVAQSQPVAQMTTPAKKQVSQDFTIPRDEKNAPIYSQIDKGFYNGDTYTVRKGDTMFLIAYIAGKDVKEIAALNNMSEPYQLRIGQTLKLSNEPAKAAPTKQTAQQTQAPKPVEPTVTYTQAPYGTAYGSDGTVTGPVKAGTGAAAGTGGTATAGTTTPTVTATAGDQTTRTTTPAPAVSSIKWQWPTQGRVISGFSSAEGGNKGIDIAGNKGQAVKAAAAGRVVYAGNALQGYGNLIIIKHSDDFLSAYAHNDSIKVDEQDNVKAGETIATLGSTGTNSNKLHFEIRYQGKSVDPTRYLPRQ